jgi:sugar phosphate isomerase/epimerase
MTAHADRSGINRRSFLGAVAAAGTAAVVARHSAAALLQDPAAPAAKPNSVINGVRIGCITYSYRGAINTAEDTLKALLQDGLSEVELMDGPIRAYAGISGGRGPRGGPNAQPAQQPPQLTDEQRAQQRQTQLAKCAQLRKMYNDAGVNIHIHKLPFGRTDEDIDFNFQVAKALGCVAITTERNEEQARRLAPFADKHGIFVAFHNHTNNVPVTDGIDPLLAIGKHIAFNLDTGHYFAGTGGKSPVPVIEKYHDRITSLHLKDRTADGGNLPWGQGKTPIKQVLQLLKKEKWPIYADIELEYPIPPGSDSVTEVAKCVQYCREALA